MGKPSFLEMIEKLGMTPEEAARAHGAPETFAPVGRGICAVCGQIVTVYDDFTGRLDEADTYNEPAEMGEEEKYCTNTHQVRGAECPGSGDCPESLVFEDE